MKKTKGEKKCCDGCGRETDNKSCFCGGCWNPGQSLMPSEEKWRPRMISQKTIDGCAELNAHGFGSNDWYMYEGREEEESEN